MMRSMLKMEEVMLTGGVTGIYVLGDRVAATIPLPEVEAFCAALQAKARAVREEAGQRAERTLREEAPAEG